MWVHINDLNYTVFIKHDDFPDKIHKINECHVFNDMILFEKSGSFYIIDNSKSSNGGFSLDYDDGGYFYFNNSDWILNTNNVPKGQEWILIESDKAADDIIQQGEYVLNQSSNEWEPIYHSSNTGTTGGFEEDGVYSIGIEVYKSPSIMGVYLWEGDGTKNDIKVGWHHYNHPNIDTALDDVDVFESLGLIRSLTAREWEYTYNGVIYYNDGDLPESTLIMDDNDSNDLILSFIDFVPLTNNAFNFDSGSQNVV